MYFLEVFSNLDLLSVAVTAVAIGILGFAVYFNNTKSITNRSLLFFSIVTVLWSVANYLYYTVSSTSLSLWFIRLVVFLGVWHAFTFFQLFYVFPNNSVVFSRTYKFVLLPIVGFASLVTLTPLVFSSVTEVSASGVVVRVQNGPGIALFTILVAALILGGVFILIQKIVRASGREKRQLLLLGYGTVATFLLIVLFNIVLPVAFNNPGFIPLSAVFILPFIILTSYSIYRHKLFNLRVAAVALFVFLLNILSFVNIVYSKELSQVVLNSSVLILIFVGSVSLIKSVLREVEQREKIEKQEKELEVINAKLNETNTQLGVANERLRELDKQKSEFVSMASHQLRSPLTAIKGYASLILDGDYGVVTDDLKHAVKIIFDSAQTLATVVSDYLNVTRIELGKMKYDLTNFDLRDLVVAVTEELRPNVEKAGLKLDFTCDTSRHYNVSADKEKLKQVLMNLIDNSVKYTPKGSVHVSLEQKPGRQVGAGSALFAVKDTGIGIHKDVIPKLFGKFSRADNAHTRDIRGTGLGLYIAKQIVEAHQGKIWAESAGEEKGSQFYLELPMVG